jgi:D-arginine dehydrogenase
MAARRIVVVGGGIAGAAVCWHLAREHGAHVVLLERERRPGTHASARNAAILRSAIRDPQLHALAAASARFYRAPPPGFAPHRLLRDCGVFLAAPAEAADELAAWAQDPECAAGAREVPVARLREAWPLLAPDVARCWWLADDGVVEVHALLHGFLAGASAAGAEVRTGAAVVDLLRDRDGAVCGVRAIGPGLPVPETLEADAVVLAGGGWAAEPAACAGLPLALHPRRRHLFVTAPLAAVRPDAPVVWLFGEEFYFRPEAGGLLLSGCDETEVEPAHGERSDPAAPAEAARRLARWLPGCAGAPFARASAAMRTFAPDRRFVLGPDPRAPGLHWAAALGGHGISCAYEAGRIVAAAAAGAAPASADAECFAPARLLNGAAARTAPASASLPA